MDQNNQRLFRFVINKFLVMINKTYRGHFTPATNKKWLLLGLE